MKRKQSDLVDEAVIDRERGAVAREVAQRTPRQRTIGTATQPRGPPAGEADAYSLAEFCKRHRISVQLYYKLAQQGLAPVTFRVGTRVLVSKESAARWRAEREAMSAPEASATTT